MPSTPAQRQRAAERKRQAAAVPSEEEVAHPRDCGCERCQPRPLPQAADSQADDMVRGDPPPSLPWTSDWGCAVCGRSLQNCECDR